MKYRWKILNLNASIYTKQGNKQNRKQKLKKSQKYFFLANQNTTKEQIKQKVKQNKQDKQKQNKTQN